MEIDRLGFFYPDGERVFRFEPRREPGVFLAYVTEDRPHAARLHDALEACGFAAWMDLRKLLPGQNWPRAIEGAIESADFFISCLSENSVRKKGGFQAEIRYALDCAREVPLDESFIVPVRLNSCRMPRTIQREYQYIDLFPDWNETSEDRSRLEPDPDHRHQNARIARSVDAAESRSCCLWSRDSMRCW